MRRVARWKRRCRVCQTRMIREEGSLVCPDITCPACPIGGLAAVRGPDVARTAMPTAPGYVPAHVTAPPAWHRPRIEPVARGPERR
jgi:hypothetical protein